MLIEGVRVTGASKVHAEHIADRDATVIARLKRAGAVLLGTLNSHEFHLGPTIDFPYGTPRNPWNLERNPGGSSSGSAAAVAAGLCSASLGGDTGGSIRAPAAFCGVVGLKPTWSRVSRDGVFPLGLVARLRRPPDALGRGGSAHASRLSPVAMLATPPRVAPRCPTTENSSPATSPVSA